MARSRKELVTVTFHYLTRTTSTDDGEPTFTPIDASEYLSVIGYLSNLPPLDTSTQDAVDKIRFASTVPAKIIKKIDDRTYLGSYKAVYSGHAYENSARGTIPHDSVSLRDFLFMLYLSESGRLYIAAQYLGQFGSYTGLKNTILRGFESRKGLEAHSFRSDVTSFQKVDAKEIIVRYVRSSDDIGKKNPFSAGATVVIRKTSAEDGFEDAARKRLFSIIDSPVEAIKKEVAKILREDQMMDIKDDDIVDCTVVAEVNGNQRRYYFINDSSYATPFPISVPLKSNGHPEVAATEKAMLELLTRQIIKKSEDV